MTSGPVIVQVLEGENAIARNREIMGATDPKKAAAGHHPRGSGQEHRAERGARLGRTRDRRPRDRLLLQRHRAAPARLRRAAAYSTMNAELSARTNLLGLPRPALEAFVARAGQQAVPRAPADELDLQARRGLVRGDDRPGEGLSRAARRASPRCAPRRSSPRSAPRMAPSSGCCARTPRRPSRWCSFRSPSAARCASPRRSAACSTARSARPRSRASTATSAPRRSSARCGWRRASWSARSAPAASTTRRRERAAMSATSPTSCSWAWASRWRTSATWCPRCASSWTTSASTCRAGA